MWIASTYQNIHTMQPHFYHYKVFADDGTLKKVITCAYKVDAETGILSYGAVNYVKDSPTDHWNRKLQLTRANVRFLNNPVKVDFGKLPAKPRSFQYRRLEKLFLDKCFYKYGMQANPEKDPQNDEGFKANRRELKLTIFSSELTEDEQDMLTPGSDVVEAFLNFTVAWTVAVMAIIIFRMEPEVMINRYA